MGQKNPTEAFPVPKPAALEAPKETPAPTATPAPPQPQIYLNITKNPTNESHSEGETAYFVANANVYESLSWTFVSPDGGEYSAQNMQARWGVVSGLNSTTLTVANLTVDMSGWGTYCTFYYKGQTARTATAYLYVKPVQPTPPSGVYYGTVSDWNYATVTIIVEGVSVTVSRDICEFDGELYYGAGADVYWDGQSVYYCRIYGEEPPEPTYGSMSGTAYEGGGGYAIDLQNGDQVYVDAGLCSVEGQFYDGCSAVVYYIDYPSGDNIYQVNIFGNQGLIIPPEPVPNDDYATGFDPDLDPMINGYATGFGF